VASRRKPLSQVIEFLEPRTLLSAVVHGPFSISAIPFTAPVVVQANAPTMAPACASSSAQASAGNGTSFDNPCAPSGSGGCVVISNTTAAGVLNLGSGGEELSGGSLLVSNVEGVSGSLTLITPPSGQIGILTIGSGSPESITLMGGSELGFDLGGPTQGGGGSVSLLNSGTVNLNLNNSIATLTAPQYILNVGTASISSSLFQLGTIPSGFSVTLSSAGTTLLANINTTDPTQ